MAVWLDILGSMVFGSLLLLSVLRLTVDMSERGTLATLAVVSQRQAAQIAGLLDTDLRRAGLGVAMPWTAVEVAEADSLRFAGDLDDDGTPDTLTYYLGPATETAGTLNPRDRYLYRRLNSEAPLRVGEGLTAFTLRYYDATGAELATPVPPGAVSQIAVQYTVENPHSQDTTYARVPMELRVVPANLNL